MAGLAMAGSSGLKDGDLRGRDLLHIPINHTLRRGEIGLLLLGMLHSLEGRLARDIRVSHPLYPPSPGGHPCP